MTDRTPPPSRGAVVGLHVKPEIPGERGLPKRPVSTLRVGPSGADGDFNRWREEERAGDGDYALLLYPVEMLDALNDEGWPIRPGDLGENILTRGLPYAELAPPGQFEVGEAVVEASKVCEPCDNLFLLPYVGKGRGPEFLKTMLDRRGWYARVLRPGTVRLGDSVRRLR